jgi:chromosome segregation ATPase
MRAVTKLERRFRRSLANLGTDTVVDDGAEEKAKLSKEIENLEAEIAKKNAEIHGHQVEIANLTVSATKATGDLADLKKANDAAQKEIGALKTAVETAKEQAAQNNAPAVTTDGDESVAALKSRLQIAEENSTRYFKRMRELRNAMRQMRAGIKGNVLNAEDVNTALEAELEALQAQREIDLIEVNVILEKLTPLVEGK